MKCKKYDEKWFGNKLLQIKHNDGPKSKKLQQLVSLAKLAKGKNLIIGDEQ